MASLHQPLDASRLRRRASFNAAPELYDAARPDYPEAVFDDLVALSGIPSGGAILEIGSGTGKATLPLVRRGFSIVGIELGEQMAALARAKLAAHPQVHIEVGAFEEWPAPTEAFDLAVSASAWHWIDPTIGYAKVAQALKPAGAFALLWSSQHRVNIPASQDSPQSSETLEGEQDAFTQALQEVSRRVAPELAQGRAERPAPGARRFVRADALEASGWFSAPIVRTYGWEMTYDTATYLQLLDSYSSYRVLDPAVHERLFAALAEMIETQFGGIVRRSWRTELYLARRQSSSRW
jgi:SAM-dependent methyltransferase